MSKQQLSQFIGGCHRARDYSGQFEAATREYNNRYGPRLERKKNPVLGLRARPSKAGNRSRALTVQSAKSATGPWKTQGIFPTRAQAESFAYAMDEAHPGFYWRLAA